MAAMPRLTEIGEQPRNRIALRVVWLAGRGPPGRLGGEGGWPTAPRHGRASGASSAVRSADAQLSVERAPCASAGASPSLPSGPLPPDVRLARALGASILRGGAAGGD